MHLTVGSASTLIKDVRHPSCCQPTAPPFATHVTRQPRRWVIANEMSDAADVQRVLSGDVDAFGRLVDRYYERCARFAVRMLGNRDDAEDALQVTFLRAYRSLGKYQERDKFSA